MDMKIRVGQYVRTTAGEIFEVTQVRKGNLQVYNIRTKASYTWTRRSVIPLWLQPGDDVLIPYADGSIYKYKFDVILYRDDEEDYEYVFYNDTVPNEILNSREVLTYIDKFAP